VQARFGIDVVVEERKRRLASIQTWANTRRRPQPTIIRPREQKKVDAAVEAYKKEYVRPAHSFTHTFITALACVRERERARLTFIFRPPIVFIGTTSPRDDVIL
jgi:hypothetical protein